MTLFNWWSNESETGDRTRDNRDHPRTDVFIELTLNCDDLELPGCHAQNISSKGAYLDLPDNLELASGTPVNLRFHIWTGRDHIARFLRAKVVRADEHGMAVRFTDHDMTTNAVVQDILYYQQYERRSEPRIGTVRTSFGAQLTAWMSRLIS